MELIEKVKSAKSQGNLHLLINDLTENGKYNINMPFLNSCNVNDKTIWIIVDPTDAERISMNNTQKIPNLAQIVGDSIISTTNNIHWKNQRKDYLEAFDPLFELPSLLQGSIERAQVAVETLNNSNTDFFNINEFLLHETQAQLQLLMFGFDDYTDQENIYIRNAFYKEDKIHMENWAKKNVGKGGGPLMEIMNDREPHSNTENIMNMLTFSFAGHDTTAHTLTWLIYEIAKNNNFYNQLKNEIDNFWKKYPNTENWKLEFM